MQSNRHDSHPGATKGGPSASPSTQLYYIGRHVFIFAPAALLLFELCMFVDDPYFYLYYGKAPRYPSYFALELEGPEVGHVLRFDSLSKVLSAGIRIGFASGPEALLRAIDQHVCSMPISSFSYGAHNDILPVFFVPIPAPILFICMNNLPTTIAN